jgi:hypothetical protein
MGSNLRKNAFTVTGWSDWQDGAGMFERVNGRKPPEVASIRLRLKFGQDWCLRST